MAREKTSRKTPRRKPKHGRGELQIGNPGNRGGTGRPPDEFKALCRAMASGELTMAQLDELLQDRTDPKFVAALRYATEYGYGKVPDVTELTGKDGAPLPQTIILGGKTIVF